MKQSYSERLSSKWMIVYQLDFFAILLLLSLRVYDSLKRNHYDLFYHFISFQSQMQIEE
jgi:hypothetical protein